MLPNTTTKGARRRWPLYALLAVGLAALALLVEAFLRAETFTPGREELVYPGIRDVIVSAEDSLYPPPDTGRFEGRPVSVFVYLSVEGLPTGEELLEARVERVGSSSAFGALFERDQIEALDEQEDLLSGGENGTTGIIKFALRTRSGEPMPPGNYTVDVYGPKDGEAAGEPEVAARKLFVVEG